MGLFWELNPGPLAPWARIMPLEKNSSHGPSWFCWGPALPFCKLACRAGVSCPPVRGHTGDLFRRCKEVERWRWGKLLSVAALRHALKHETLYTRNSGCPTSNQSLHTSDTFPKPSLIVWSAFLLRKRALVQTLGTQISRFLAQIRGASLIATLKRQLRSWPPVENTARGWTLKLLHSTKMKPKPTSSPSALPNLQLAPGLSWWKSNQKKPPNAKKMHSGQQSDSSTKDFGCTWKKCIFIEKRKTPLGSRPELSLQSRNEGHARTWASCVLHWGQDLSCRFKVAMKGAPGLEPGTCWSTVSRPSRWAMRPAMLVGLEIQYPGLHKRCFFLGRKALQRMREGLGKVFWNVKSFGIMGILRWGRDTHCFACKDFHAWIHALMHAKDRSLPRHHRSTSLRLLNNEIATTTPPVGLKPTIFGLDVRRLVH